MPKILVNKNVSYKVQWHYALIGVYKSSRLDTQQEKRGCVCENYSQSCILRQSLEPWDPDDSDKSPTTPLEIVVKRNFAWITCHIPIAVEFLTGVNLALAGEDPETLPEAMSEVDWVSIQMMCGHSGVWRITARWGGCRTSKDFISKSRQGWFLSPKWCQGVLYGGRIRNGSLQLETKISSRPIKLELNWN